MITVTIQQQTSTCKIWGSHTGTAKISVFWDVPPRPLADGYW